jgi:hypothetical protein
MWEDYEMMEEPNNIPVGMGEAFVAILPTRK